MAGAALKLNYRYPDQIIGDAMDRLVKADGDMETAFADFGEYLLISHGNRHEQQVSPDGSAWEPLSPKYKARKKKNADKILTLEGAMRNLLAYNASASGLEFGSNQIYAATHQFGDPGRGIPAREHIGLSSEDEAELATSLGEHLEEALRS